MEVTESLFYMLLALQSPKHGYEIMSSVELISEGRVTMGAGTCYGLITRCLDDGIIRLEREDGRKKIYAITEKGQEVLHNEMTRMIACLNNAMPFFSEEEADDEQNP